MSDEESQKTGSTESTVGGTAEQPGQASISVDTRVQNVLARPSYDLTTLSEGPIGVNPSRPEQATALGRPVCIDSSPPASVILPSARRLHFSPQLYSSFRHPVITHASFNDQNNYVYGDENSYAIIICGLDEYDREFTQACFNDGTAIRDIVSQIIPRNNIYLITPDSIRTEREIEYLYVYIKRNRPQKLFLYYSGHHAANQPRLNVRPSDQGNALDISMLKTFIESLLPHCIDLTIILDCCSAGENLLIPMLPAGVLSNRVHVQLSSCKAGGKSYIYAAGRNSIFSSCIISALTGAAACPNRDINCPLCLKMMMFIRQNGYTKFTSTDLFEYVHEHMRHNSHQLTERDLPQYMMNPVARD